MQNQEKIIQAIAAIIAKNTLGVSAQHNKYAQEVAAEITAAIAPHLEAGAGLEDRVIVDLREKIGKVKRNIELDRESVALSYCDKIDDVLCKLM